MTRLFLCALICLMVIPIPLMAQDSDPWKSACHQKAQAAVAQIVGEERYQVGCEALSQCQEHNPLAPIGCERPVYDALMDLCEGDDCALQSRFYMASLLIFERPPRSIYAYIPREVQAAFEESVRAFQAGRYQTVIDLYETISSQTEMYQASPFQDFIVGLMYEELGNLEAATASYQTSVKLLRLPFVTVQRAEVLLQMGDEDLAVAEALTVSDDPIAKKLLAEHAPLKTERWMLYAVERRYGGEYGSAVTDDTMRAGLPIQVAFLSDDSLLISGASNILMPFTDDILSNAALFYPSEEDESYIWEGFWFAFSVRLMFEDQIGVAKTLIIGGMADSESRVLIAPAGLFDPREGQSERCGEGARWRLKVDGYGAASRIFGEGTPYYNRPNGEPVGTLNVDMQTFRVVDGPVCVENESWWEIDPLQNDGQTYWLPEAEAQTNTNTPTWFYSVYPWHPPTD